MMKHYTLTLLFLLSLLIVHAQPKYEMRGAWIATVANIDWPSNNHLSVEQQQQELIAMFDTLEALNMNAVVFQIRPTADALYDSSYELWSRFLTGEQGLAPEPYWDPLAFAVYEAHKRFIEVHVWLNPYRLLNSDKTEFISQDHLFYKRPELFVKYGTQYYFNPGLDETRSYLNQIVADIVMRYDIDAVHFDDYFYPYRIAGQEFPDVTTFKENPRGYTDIEDWRRHNVDMVIEELSQTIRSIKPWVEFGISPFGVWRNKSKDPERGSETKGGQTNYDDLYADILKWLEEGTIDYVVPQLYWEIGKKVADYTILADWWSRYSYGKNLYIGLYTSQMGNPKAAASWREGNELMRQFQVNKQHPEILGTVQFSMKGLMQNKMGIADSLRNGPFKYPALVPVANVTRGTASAAPSKLRIERMGQRNYLMWDNCNEREGNAAAYYVVYLFKGDEPVNIHDPKNIVARVTDGCLDLTALGLDSPQSSYIFAVTTVNRYKIESKSSRLKYRFK